MTRTSILGNAAYLSGARGLGIGVRGLYLLLLARELGPADYGTYAYGQAWYLALLPLAALGMQHMLGREIGRDRVRAVDLASAAFGLRLLSGIFASGVSVTAAWLAYEGTPLFAILAWFSLALFGRSLATWVQHVLVGTESSQFVLRQEVLFRPSEALVGAAILLGGGGLMDVVVLHAIIWWLQFAAGYLLVRRHVGPVAPSLDVHLTGVFLRAALLLVPMALAQSWMWQGPLLLYRPMADDLSTLGQLGLVLQLLSLLQFLPVSVGAAMMPVLSRSAARGDDKDLMFLSLALRLSLLGGTLVALVVQALGKPTLTFLLSQDYASAAPLIAIGIWTFVLFSAAILCGNVMIARGMYGPATVSAIAASILMSLFIFPTAQLLGAAGVIVAMLIAQASWLGMALAVLRRRILLPILPLLLPSAAAVALATASYYLASPYPLMALALSIAVLAAATVGFSAISAEERKAFWVQISKRLPRR